jgi:5'-3' exonuclease
MSTKRIAIVDFSAIFYRMWHGTGHLEVNEAHSKTVGQILGYAQRHDHCVVAIDSPPYSRRKLDPEYKGQREKDSELLKGQRLEAIEQLRRLGFCLLEEAGLEADDMIASAVAALAKDLQTWDGVEGPLSYEITVYSADKDLLALHADTPCRVRVVSTATHEERTPQDVFDVEPKFVPHVLAIVGDTSDNVSGIRGIGPKKAAALIDAISFAPQGGEKLEGVPAIVQLATDCPHEVAAHLPDGMGEAAAAAIIEAVKSGQLERSLQLTTLVAKPDLVDVERVFAAREQAPAEPGENYGMGDDEPEPPPVSSSKPTPPPPDSAPEVEGEPAELPPLAPPPPKKKPKDPHLARYRLTDEPAQSTAMVVRPEEAFEPQTREQAWGAAKMTFESRALKGYGAPEQIMLVVMAGRTRGMTWVDSLNGYDIIEGTIAARAQTMIAWVLQDPRCELLYIDWEKTNDEQAVAVVKRSDWPKEQRMKYTLKEAERAGLLNRKGWKYRIDMLVNRLYGRIARQVFPDISRSTPVAEELRDL